jgi:hypothetical protein
MLLPERKKYGRTFHFPWSPGATSDDKIHAAVENLFAGREVIVTEKLDGENTTIYADGYTHARSLDSKSHRSRDWVRSLANRIGAEGLPPDLRICGENLYARHSIAYDRLESYFLVFGIYDQEKCLSWDDTVAWCELLGLVAVPVLYRGEWDEAKVKACWTGKSTASPGADQEGYVLRLAEAFDSADFGQSVAKMVRQGHVQTTSHWMYEAIVPNRLRAPAEA